MSDITIRLLQEAELAEAERIFRLAFGTFVGLPDPMQFAGDASYFPHRWQTEPTAAFAAQIDERLAGSILGVQWGSFSYFGPLSVHPDFWQKGIAKSLIVAMMERFDAWGTTHAGLCTFPGSPKHLGLYQKFGFYPRFLTPVMTKPISHLKPTLARYCYSQLSEGQKAEVLRESRSLTDAIYEGLDLSKEILAVDSLQLGDTVLLWDDDRLLGFAVCHCGKDTEAGSQACFVKFGAVRPGIYAGEHFERLLDLGEALGFAQGLTKLIAGVNTSHYEAYNRMLARGFRTDFTCVAMQKPNEPGFNRPDVFVLDDWR